MESSNKWFFLVKRELSLLFDEFINQGQNTEDLKKLLNVDFGLDHYRAVNFQVSYLLKEVEEANKKVRELYLKEGVNRLKNIFKRFYLFMNELEKIALEISKKDYSNSTDKELIAELKRLKKGYYKFSCALYSPLLIGNLTESIIKEKLKNNNKADEYFNILTAIEKETEGTKELKSMLKIALKLKEGKDISKEVKKHIDEFGWINTRGFYGDKWNEEDVKERVKAMIKEDVKSRLEKLDNQSKENREKTEKILSEIKADNEFKDIVSITKEAVHFRTHRMDVFVKSGFLARPLFKEIAKRLNLKLDDLFNLTSAEIENVLLKEKDYSDLIKERRKGFGFILYKRDITVLVGKELEDYIKKYMSEEIDPNIREIKGKMASPGIVKGIVKVLSGKQELSKIQKGEILVASMTTPDFVPAMEKAAAFVTDEGGILCHAAIVSREMEKPCVIGTKIATKVLKDGDFVEVDANKGIVTILKRD